MRTITWSLWISAVLALSGPIRGNTLLIAQPGVNQGYGYGLSSWTGMTSDLNAAFGAANITVNDALDNLSYMETFDSLLLVPAAMTLFHFDVPLFPADIANLQAYIATGRRVLLVGENRGWSNWDQSILTAVGGSFGGAQTADDILTPAVTNSLTEGVRSLDTAYDGIAAGGTSLFDQNVATLWPGNGTDNVLSLLSVDVEDDTTGSAPGNMQFKKNVANWLAGDPAGVPEPSSWIAAGLGISLLFAGSRRRRTSR